MERLEKTLEAWQACQGWREPVRTVGEAAERLGTDTGTLYAYFRDRIGLDFRTWRTRLRLEDAKRMLADNPLLPPADVRMAETGRDVSRRPGPENDYV